MFGWLGFSFLLMRNPRCINIDWLEVHAREGGGIRRDAYYYSTAGYNVKEREYGTRVYRQMFTICTPADEPLLEIWYGEFQYCNDMELKNELMSELRKGEGFEDRYEL